MKNLKRIILGLIVVSAILALGFIVWANNAAQPTEVALQALTSDSQVTVTQRDDSIVFEPATQPAATGFIFYPGGRVDVRAYAPVLRMIAARGYFVVAVKVKLNLAFFDENAADRVMAEYPQIERWAVGGHSLGGVAASDYVAKNLDRVSGLILWASYPAGDSLAATNMPVLSIYGTNDMAGVERFVQSQSQLPADAQFVVIEGGNHSQFGSYGLQNGDHPATISPEEQWSQVADATAQFLMSLTR